MFYFKFGEKSKKDSPSYKKLKEQNSETIIKIYDKLKTIEGIIQDKGFTKTISQNKYLKQIKLNRKQERLYQINITCSHKREFRILFVIRKEIGLIINLFLKKDTSQEQKEYIKALNKAKYYF